MPKDEQFEILDEGAEHLYSNLISFSINAEEVCMGLGIRDIRSPSMVDVHSYLHLTIPHFLRFAEAVNEQVNLLIERGVISRGDEPEQ
ncbi:MAG: hypothetical protein GY940_20960 [bacterium]|nr:hypothetical protein [bacterium]